MRTKKKRVLRQFNANGLKFPVEHLIKIQDEIAFYDIDKMAKYADKVCVKNYNNIKFLKSHMDLKDYDFENFNATSLGNLAYLSKFSPAPYNDMALKIIQDYRNFLKNKTK